MILLTPDQTATLRDWFLPDRPGRLVGLHVINTRNGACFADRWPEPRAIWSEVAGNGSFAGDPGAFSPDDLKDRVAGFVEAPEPFEPLLRAAFSSIHVWDRVVLDLQAAPRHCEPRRGEAISPPGDRDPIIRRLEPADAYHLWGLSPNASWIARTWGGPAGLAAGRHAWGAFASGRLASVACTFFVGHRYEEIGVATEPEFRGAGLGTACAGALCRDIQDRGRIPSWTTSPDNIPSLRVAQKLGFSLQRRDRLLVINTSIPEPVA